MENASSQVSNLLRKESGESGSMMDPPNPSSKTDARSSFEGVRIAKHAMKKATKKARFLESAFVLLLRCGRFFSHVLTIFEQKFDACVSFFFLFSLFRKVRHKINTLLRTLFIIHSLSY